MSEFQHPWCCPKSCVWVEGQRPPFCEVCNLDVVTLVPLLEERGSTVDESDILGNDERPE